MQCHYIVEIAALLQFPGCHSARYVSLQQFAFVTLSGVLKISPSIHVQRWKIASHRDELNQLVIPMKINVFSERGDIWGINQNPDILSILECCQNSELLRQKSWILKRAFSVQSPFWWRESPIRQAGICDSTGNVYISHTARAMCLVPWHLPVINHHFPHDSERNTNVWEIKDVFLYPSPSSVGLCRTRTSAFYFFSQSRVFYSLCCFTVVVNAQMLQSTWGKILTCSMLSSCSLPGIKLEASWGRGNKENHVFHGRRQFAATDLSH